MSPSSTPYRSPAIRPTRRRSRSPISTSTVSSSVTSTRTTASPGGRGASQTRRMCAGIRSDREPGNTADAVDRAASSSGAQLCGAAPGSATTVASTRDGPPRSRSTAHGNPMPPTPRSASTSTTQDVGNSGRSSPAGTRGSAPSGAARPSSSSAGSLAVVWVTQPRSSTSSSSRRAEIWSAPSRRVTWTSRGAERLTGVRNATSAIRWESSRDPAAARRVHSNTAAGTISTPRTGCSPGKGRDSRSSLVTQTWAPDPSVSRSRDPSRVCRAGSWPAPNVDGRRCSATQCGRRSQGVVGRSTRAPPGQCRVQSTSAPWQYSAPSPRDSASRSGRPRRSECVTNASSIPRCSSVSLSECSTTGCGETSRNRR